MPELPEVETIARYLDAKVQGCTVDKVVFYRRDLREPIPTSLFKKVVQGDCLRQVFRRSKYLLFETSQGYGIFHLGMTGKLLLLPEARPSLPHTHLTLRLQPSDGAEPLHLHYIDPRRFGRIAAHAGKAWQDHPFLSNLGREPLEGRDLGKYLRQAGSQRRAPIKNFLMDNRVLVGVGNIYASEALFRARIHPEKPCHTVSSDEYERLGRELRKILREAITAGGTSFRDYRNAEGQAGYFSLSLQVYGRKGEACSACGNPITMLRQAGRSTCFCAVCQI